MVISYLEKTKEEFFETKASLNEQLVAVQNHYKENLKMIQLLEEHGLENMLFICELSVACAKKHLTI